MVECCWILLFNLPILVVLYDECHYPIAKMLPNINQYFVVAQPM